MSNFYEYSNYDAIGLAELVRKKEVTATELLEEAISRIENSNPIINAVVTKLYDEAKDAISSGLPEGPFAGVPFLLKEFDAYAGAPITYGSRYFVDNICERDSEIVTRFKNSGLVILGKTNVPELGISATTESKLYGPCRNPFNTSITTGGSSGGSAAAVASGMVPVAHGSDGGGSIRIPASCCGLFGMKTSRGRNPAGPILGEIWNGLVVTHVLSKSVRDSAAFLDITAGPDIGAPYYLKAPKKSFLSQITAKPKELKIAVSDESAFEINVDDECKKAVHETCKTLTDMGHKIEYVSLDYIDDPTKFWEAFYVVMMANTDSTINKYTNKTGIVPTHESFEKWTWLNLQWSKYNSATKYVESMQLLHQTGRKIAQLFQKYDLLITPTLAKPPPPIGYLDTMLDFEEFSKRAAEYFLFSAEFNVSGNPAMSMPLHITTKNIPVGVQFVGKFGDEKTLFQLAAAIEQAKPWIDKIPIIHASND